MKTVHYYPSPKPNGEYSNPYSMHYRDALGKYFKVVDTQLWKGDILPLELVFSALFRGDIYIFNWIENFGYKHLKRLHLFLILLCFKIIKARGKKLVWMFHNIHPHSNDSLFSNKIRNFLFENADLIIAHSKEAAVFAKHHTKKENVIFRHHPIVTPLKGLLIEETKTIDVLIWGEIFPYKGVLEFVQYINSKGNILNVHIIGRCKDKLLAQAINEQCNEHIHFQNTRVEFSELKVLIAKSKFVLFPYIGDCVSSSGALIDTIAMGGNSLGPNVGAFKDLEEEGCCLTYTDYDDMVCILNSERKINKENIEAFLRYNSWDSFVNSIIEKLNS